MPNINWKPSQNSHMILNQKPEELTRMTNEIIINFLMN